jgi:outer membrane receptor protein involved in Fe transport
VGLRYDYFDIGKQVFDEGWVEQWKLAVNYNAGDPNTLSPDWLANQRNGSSFLYYATHGYVSPRLAIGYPVTDRIVFYFNYGHFLQFPDRDFYYRDPYGQGPPRNLVGNPNLKPQRTVSYEAGFKDQFSDDMMFSVAAFYKDIFDYPTTVARGDNLIYINFDYASVRGFEFTFKEAFSGNFSVDAAYAYQLAKGRTSNSLAAAINPQFQLPRETRLDYDQNHTVNVYARYGVGANEPGTLFGLPFFNNYSMSLTWSYGSGFPYTPFTLRTTARNQYLVNNETKPYTSTVNFSFNKGFAVLDRMTLSLTLDVTNLFNRRNVVDVFNYTGAPVKYGDVYSTDPTTIYPYRQWDFRDDPTNFDVGRQVLLGIKATWD